MKVSSMNKIRDFYGETADSYDKMMDAEIKLPIYMELLSELSERITSIHGFLVDTSCGSGHMLALYHSEFDKERPLVALDISPEMVEITRERLPSDAEVIESDMRDLSVLASGSSAALISFFALHHLDQRGIIEALNEWNRVLRPGGQLLIATWEGNGKIDYGEMSDIIALRYTTNEISNWVSGAGFKISDCLTEPVEEMFMDAIYLSATKK